MFCEESPCIRQSNAEIGLFCMHQSNTTLLQLQNQKALCSHFTSFNRRETRETQSRSGLVGPWTGDPLTRWINTWAVVSLWGLKLEIHVMYFKRKFCRYTHTWRQVMNHDEAAGLEEAPVFKMYPRPCVFPRGYVSWSCLLCVPVQRFKTNHGRYPCCYRLQGFIQDYIPIRNIIINRESI